MKRGLPWLLCGLSLGLLASLVALQRVELPFTMDNQRDQLLLMIGAAVWPAVLAPWLQHIPKRGRMACAWLVPLAGYALLGQPPFGFLHGVPLPNLRLLPWAALAGVTGAALVWAIGEFSRPAMRSIIPAVALVVAAAIAFGSTGPLLSAMRAQPGTVLVADLEVKQTVKMTGVAHDPGLQAFTWRDALIIIAPASLLWLTPSEDGGGYDVASLDMPFDVRQIEIQDQGDRLFIVEGMAGRVRCLAYPDGALVWEAAGLGTIDQSVWTSDSAWFLDTPDYGEKPAVARATIHRVSLADGAGSAYSVTPPTDVTWNPGDYSTVGGVLGRTGETVFFVGFDQPFVYRPPQRSLPALTAPMPQQVLITSDLRESSCSFGMSGNIVCHYVIADGSVGIGASDLTTGALLWSKTYGGNGMSGSPLTVLPDRVLVSLGGLTSGGSDGLVCIDPRSGEERWQANCSGVPFWVEPVGESALVMTDGLLTSIDGAGQTLWTYRTSGAAYLLSADIARDQLVLFESGGQQLPNSGYWGSETVLCLSTGAVVAKPEDQLGNYNYIALDGLVVRTAGRRGSDYLQDTVLMKLDGYEVGIRDPIRHTDYVLARPGLLVTAYESAGGEATLCIIGKK